jgi:hypothetical protein
MTIEDLEKKIETKRKQIEAVPKLRKELKELENQLKQEHLLEVSEAMDKAGVTPQDVTVALEKGLIKPIAAVATPNVTAAVKAFSSLCLNTL